MNRKMLHTVLSNDVRTRLVMCLGTGGKTVGELRSVCGLSQSAVSQHLMKLRAAGAVASEKRGRERVYRTADRRLVQVCRTIIKLIHS